MSTERSKDIVPSSPNPGIELYARARTPRPGRWGRWVFLAIALVCLIAAVGGASYYGEHGRFPKAMTAEQPTPASSPALLAASSGPSSNPAGVVQGHKTATYRLVTEPGAGMTPIYRFIESARHSLDMTMYELKDTTAERLLAADAKRGVQVRVILDKNYEQSYNEPAYRYLSQHEVKVRWAPSSYDLTHEKTITVDGATSLVMTLNLTSQYYSTSRDFGVFVHQPSDVRAIVTVFDHDFAGDKSSPEPSGANLVWSPGADARLVALINSARHRVYVEDEEMAEYTIVDALCAAAKRGVNVEVVMTNSSSWRSNFNKLVRAGVKVRTYAENARLYIHAKVIDVDPGYSDAAVDIGSQNFSWTSLQYNRELGVILHDPAIEKAIAHTVAHDFAGGHPWK